MSPITDHVADQVDDLVHSLVDGETAARIATHCATCQTCLAALEAAQQRLTALRALPPIDLPPPLVEQTVQRVKAAALPRRRPWRLTLAAAAIFLVAILTLGGVHAHYASLRPSPADLVVLGQSEFLVDTAASVRIRLVDRNNGAPIAGQPVKLTLLRPGNDPTDLLSNANLTTDAQGGAEPRFHVPDWPDGTYSLTITAGGETISHSVQLKRSWQILLSTDKPVYQPGQTIKLRALALRQPDMKPVAGQSATFTITDPHGNVVFKHTGPTSRFGIAGVTRRNGKVENVECALADETSEGTWTVICRVGATETRRTVEVMRYVLPKYKVDIKTNNTFYGPGSVAHVDVTATYFTGKPVVDAKVTLTPTMSHGIDIKPQEKRTSVDGSAGFDVQIPPSQGGDAQVVFQAAVDDGGRVPQSALAQCAISDRPVRIEVQPEGGTLVEGVPNTVYFMVTQADGRPMRLKLSADGLGTLQCDDAGVAFALVTPKGRETRWTIRGHDDKGDLRTEQSVKLLCGQVPNDFLVRTDKAVYRGGDTVRLTALGGGDQPVFVDLVYAGSHRTTLLAETVPLKDGQGVVSFPLPPEACGTLELCAYRFPQDQRYTTGLRGPPSSMDGAIVKTRLLCVQPASDLQIRTTFNKADGYRPGETARLDFQLVDAAGHPRAGALGLTAIDSAVYAVLAQRPGQERSFLAMHADSLRPITDTAPGWVPGEQEQRDQALMARTARTVSYDSYHDPVLHSMTEDSYARKVLATIRERRYALGWVARGYVMLVIATLIGLYLISLWWLPGEARVLVHVIGVCLALPMCCGIGVSVFRGCESRRTQTTSQLMVSKSGREDEPSQFMHIESGPLIPDMWPRDEENAPVAASQIEQRTRRIVFAPEEGKSGEWDVDPPGGAGSPAPRLRQFFPETLLWRPELVTDDDGRASLELELPDSLTTWKLLATAVGTDGKLGAEEREFKVFQPFFVDFDLPVTLTRNDEVEVLVTVFNYLKKTQKVTLTLADNPGIERVGDQAAEQQVEVPEGGKQHIRYRVKAKTVGLQKLQILARGEGQGAADAVLRKIEVLPDGQRFEKAWNGTLRQGETMTHEISVPADAIDGSARALVKIYPSSFSQLLEGLDGLFQMPHGCFEQTSSTTYPNVLALDYLQRTKLTKPATEANARHFVHVGYQRLLSFEVPGGGFDWFGHAPANRTLTAYGLMEFEDMAKVYDVDPQVIKRTRSWLLQQRQRDGSWLPDSRLHDDPVHGNDSQLASTAYIAWAVFANGAAAEDRGPTLNYLLARRPADIRDVHALALVCNALLALDPKGEAARPYLERLESRKETDDSGRFAFWRQEEGGRTLFHGAGNGGQIETTALAVLALLHDPARGGSCRQGLAWIADQKGPNGTWQSTQATVLSLKALLAGTGKPLGGDGTRRVIVKVDGQPVETVDIAGDKAEVLVPVDLRKYLAPGKRVVVGLTEETATGAGYQVTLRYHQPAADARDALLRAEADLELSRKAVAEFQSKFTPYPLPTTPEAMRAMELDFKRREEEVIRKKAIVERIKSELKAVKSAFDLKLDLPAAPVKVGQSVAVKAQLSLPRAGTAPMVMLELPVPAGFVLDAEGSGLDELVRNKKIARFELRPGWVVVYLTELRQGAPFELTYRLRAVTPAQVLGRGARAYEYYDPDRKAETSAVPLTVEE